MHQKTYHQLASTQLENMITISAVKWQCFAKIIEGFFRFTISNLFARMHKFLSFIVTTQCSHDENLFSTNKTKTEQCTRIITIGTRLKYRQEQDNNWRTDSTGKKPHSMFQCSNNRQIHKNAE